MTTFNRILSRLLFLFLIIPVAVPKVLAQNAYEENFDDYIVHFNAFPSKSLEPEISQSVGIPRSVSRGVITIVVNKQVGDDKQSVKARINGTATNLIGQKRKLKLKEIRDDDVYYYIGDFPIVKNESLTFNISVTPEDSRWGHEFNFSRLF